MDSVFYSCPQDFIAQGWTWTGASTIPYSMIGITTRISTLWTTYHRTGYGKPNRLASFQQKAAVVNFRGNECQQLGLVPVQWTTSNDLEYESGGEPWAGEEVISDTVLSSNEGEIKGTVPYI
jgi:hypothetical protein